MFNHITRVGQLAAHTVTAVVIAALVAGILALAAVESGSYTRAPAPAGVTDLSPVAHGTGARTATPRQRRAAHVRWLMGKLPACRMEDSPGPCAWNGRREGNGRGRSFVNLEDTTYYLNGEVRHNA